MKTAKTFPLEEQLGYRFRQPELLEHALTHSSLARQLGQPGADNERLEFLGDAILGLLSAEALLRRFPGHDEGELSKLRAHLVSQPNLSETAKRLGVNQCLRLGRGEEKTGGRQKAALLADAMEAIIAAIYLDAGLETAREFVERVVLVPELERVASTGEALMTQIADYKSRLQELLQAGGSTGPVYSTVGQKGPDHRKQFTIEAHIALPGGETLMTRGTGLTKKQAEQIAAQKAFERLTAEAEKIS
jgi:ribonuclease-3